MRECCGGYVKDDGYCDACGKRKGAVTEGPSLFAGFGVGPQTHAVKGDLYLDKTAGVLYVLGDVGWKPMGRAQ